MFNFVKNYLTKREGIKEYSQVLDKFMSDKKLDESEKIQLEELIKKYNLSKDDLKKIQAQVSSVVFKNISDDERITEQEKEEMELLLKYFELGKDDFEFNQKNFNKYYSLALIDKGVLPTPENTGLNIIFKKGEILHWLCSATAKKRKKITERYNYSGLTASVKIMKGLRYRVGSIKLAPQVKEIMADEDYGNFWLTNQRLGFLGNKKNFSLLYKKILSFELYKDGISIHKEGKETPYILGLGDVEVPAAILSFILNNQ